MPTCDFYAARDDSLTIVDFIFDQPGWVLSENSSRHDLPLRKFASPSEVTDAIELGVEDAYLALHAPSMRAPIIERKITFNPGAVPGTHGRTDAVGWGLIQVYLISPRKKQIRPSHTGHNSERRARKWEPIYADELGTVDAWDWREVERISSRLNRFIRRLAVGKERSRVILPAAAAAVAGGATLALNA
jgi:hypothetical protein